MPAKIDFPKPGGKIDPLCILVRGWVWLDTEQDQIAAVEAWSDDTVVGESRALFARPDVNASVGAPARAGTAFEIFAHHANAKFDADTPLRLRVRFADGSRSDSLADVTCRAIARDYRQHEFGVVLRRDTTAVQRDDNIFATGPSQTTPNPELLELMRRYLGSPPVRVLDVGCGLASYGRALLADGYEWLGAEIDPADCAELARLNLPFRQVDGRTLPFDDASFAAALCVEVLEHVADPPAFLREVKRVAPHQLIVSVPNCELLGYLAPYLATPWHMLESTHVNYFTRWSLEALLRQFYGHVELRFYSPYPLRTVESTVLYYHILAIAQD